MNYTEKIPDMGKTWRHERTQYFPHIFMPSTDVIEILPNVIYSQDKAQFLSILNNLREVVVSHDFVDDAKCSLKRNGVLRKIKESSAVERKK